MKKHVLKKLIRDKCPNSPTLRRLISSYKLAGYKRYALDASEVMAGERSRDSLIGVIKNCSRRWGREYSRIVEVAKAHFKRAGKQLDNDTLNDIIFCYFAYGFTPDEYLCFDFKNRTVAERREFLSDRDRKIIVYSVNDIIDIERFLDKWKTYQRYGEYYKRAAIVVGCRADWPAFTSFLSSHDRFVFKDTRLSKGESVRLINRCEIADQKKFFEETINNGCAILEELITQSQIMSRINSTSVNTVRVITLLTKNGVEIVDCFLKTGRNGSFVDNGGAGGLLVGIDSDTGCLSTDARDEFGNIYSEHPDSMLHFKKYQLPDWESLLELACKVSGFESGIKYIGWDFAHTYDGWVIVEGNASSQLIGPQIVTQAGTKARILSILSNVNQILDISI